MKTFRYNISKMLLSTLVVASGLSVGSTQVNAADLDSAAFEKAMDAYLQKDNNLEKIGGSISAFFQRKRQEQAQQAQASESDRLNAQFENPVTVDVGDSPFKGPKDAPITVVEFSDFQCPFCSKGKDIVSQLVKEYPTQVKVVFKNLPLDFHPEAKPAAIAALAAGRQNKFWEMHDYLFENQKLLSSDFYLDAAKHIGLNVDTFKKDIKDPALEAAIQKDLALAKTLSVQGTPNFFVNGVNLRGAYPIEQFKAVVDRWLEKLKTTK